MTMTEGRLHEIRRQMRARSLVLRVPVETIEQLEALSARSDHSMGELAAEMLTQAVSGLYRKLGESTDMVSVEPPQ